MSQSSTLGWEMAPEFPANQPITVEAVLLHQNPESQSAICSNVRYPHITNTPMQPILPTASPFFIVASPAMRDLFIDIERACNSSAPMLITGETGTGKELLSRAVHAISARHEREFIAFNCTTVNHELIESQLFGHRRGSFTGAISDSKGIIRSAEDGTLLLDEIGELSLEVQPKLLRFLQEGEVHPVGAARPVKTNVRVIAATNCDLDVDVCMGRFRADLFERLNILRLRVPPLRERREDIQPLIEHFFKRFQQEQGKQGLWLSNEAAQLMLNYNWPRNVRQLANEVLRLVTWASNGKVIDADCLSPEIRAEGSSQSTPAAIVQGRIVIDPNLPYRQMKEELEKLAIIHAIKQTNGNLSQAAARLQMNRDGLRKAINRLGIDVKGTMAAHLVNDCSPKCGKRRQSRYGYQPSRHLA